MSHSVLDQIRLRGSPASCAGLVFSLSCVSQDDFVAFSGFYFVSLHLFLKMIWCLILLLAATASSWCPLQNGMRGFARGWFLVCFIASGSSLSCVSKDDLVAYPCFWPLPLKLGVLFKMG